MREIVDDYRDHQWFVGALLLHSFFSVFFYLWGLAADVFGKELVASKAFHVLFCLLVLHWWTVSRYPFLEAQLAGATWQKDPDFARHRIKAEFRFHLKTGLGFAGLFLIDVLFAGIQLLPVAIQCIRHRDTGEKLSKYCGGTADGCELLDGGTDVGNRPDFATFYYLTIFATAGQAVLELAMVFRSVSRIRRQFSSK